MSREANPQVNIKLIEKMQKVINVNDQRRNLRRGITKSPDTSVKEETRNLVDYVAMSDTIKFSYDELQYFDTIGKRPFFQMIMDNNDDLNDRLEETY